MCRVNGGVVNLRLFHQRAIIEEICINQLLEKVAYSQKQDMSACGIETQQSVTEGRLGCSVQHND